MKKIVPHSRLLLWTAVGTLPFALIAAVFPPTRIFFFIAFSVLFILAVVDAGLSLKRLDGIRILLPDVVRLSKNRSQHIELTVLFDGSPVRRLRIGLPFPEQIGPSQRDFAVSLPDEGKSFSLSWPCTGLKRGRYFLNDAYIEAPSRLGLWVCRGKLSVSCEIRVYPNLFSERKEVAAVFTNKNLGIHSHRQIGKGRDFEQLREYMPGDSFEDIHWKATAKTGYPVTKVFQIERTQEIYIIIDASRLSTRKVITLSPNGDFQQNAPDGSEIKIREETIFERFITASLMVGLAAERQGDLFGLITFTDQVHGFIRAKNGKAHYDACRDMLFTLEPQIRNPDFTDLFTFIGTKIRKRSLLLFFTCLDDPVLSENFIHHIHLPAKKHVLLINMIHPSGARPLFSSPDIHSMDDIYTALGNHLVWRNIKETERLLLRQGAEFSLLDNEKLCAQVIAQYLNVKKRQIL